MANPTSTTKVQFHSVPVLSTASIQTGYFYHDQSTERFYLALGNTFGACKELTNDEVTQALANLTATQVKYGENSNVAAELSNIYGQLSQVAVLSTLTGSATIATNTNSIVTIKGGITESNGVISNDSSADVTLAKVAVTGEAEDVAFSSSLAGYAGVDNVADGLEAVPGIVNTALNGYATEAYVGSAIGSITGSTITASQSSNTITIASALTQANGIVSAVGTITLADVAATGAAEDIAYENTDSGLTAVDVQGAIDELAEASAGGVASKTVYMVDNGATSDYAKVYKFYQGSEGSASDPEESELLGTINIPKDKVVEDGSVVTIYFDESDNTLHEGSISGTDVTELIVGTGTATAADAGKYIKLELENVTDPLYIAAKSLVDIYTAAAGATEVQLAIDSNNVISATLVDGGVSTAKLANNAVTTAKLATGAVTSAILADDAVTAAKIDDGAVGTDALATDAVTTVKILDEAVTEAKLSSALVAKINDASGVTAVAEGTTNGTVSVTTKAADGTATTSDVAVHGLGTAAYVDIEDYDYTVTATTGSATSQSGSSIKALVGFEIENGQLKANTTEYVDVASLITTAKNDIIGSASDTASDNTIYGAKKYADSKELVWQVASAS